jgi:hypothetical protein
MPDITGHLAQRPRVNTTLRAVAAWERIQDRATSITVYRGSPASAQDAQTVRVEWDNERARLVTTDAGTASQRRGVIFGVRNHPTAADTDLQKDDRIRLDDGDYRVIGVIEPPGEVQASIERIS